MTTIPPQKSCATTTDATDLLDDAALLRYSRHILLPEIDIEGQTRIRSARVLVVGAGGLGCPAALYLARAGVGVLTVADGDTVDATNLQRQILYTESDIGRPKAEAAADALRLANPDVTVTAVPHRLAQHDLDALVAASDVVLDCTDNFATRHAINRACVRHCKPLVSGAAIRFDAQLAVFDVRASASPCYHCLFPEGENVTEVRCATMGVFAPLVGVVGALQAHEALKVIVGCGEPSWGKLWLFDGLGFEWRSIRVPRDPACPVCRDRPARDE